MNPIHHRSNNMLLGANGIPNTIDVTATMLMNDDDTFNSIATMWKPTPQELELLNANGCVILTVHSTSHPPVWVSVSPL